MKEQNKHWTVRKCLLLAAISFGVVVMAVGGAFAIQRVRSYNDASNQADIVGIRELILLAVRGLKKDAPVDPRTGDVYFPESKLYVPNPGFTLPLTYLQDTGNVTDSQGELSVSTYPVRGTQALYTARNSQELFAAVPKLQACSRGVKLVYAPFPANDTQNVLKHTVHLQNGKHLYVYVEKDCPELNGLADALQQVKAF
jgi:hypothetical protein